MSRASIDCASSQGQRGGFTLVEVVVALAVSGIILVGARAMLDMLGDSANRIAQAAADADARANGDRLLRSLLTRLEVGTQEAHPFSGGPREVMFTTWCDTPAGWLERCDASVRLESQGDTNTLVARLSPVDPRANLGPTTIVLARGFHTGVFRYLNDPGLGGRWFIEWGTGIVTPLAVGVILDSDTTIVRIGERG